MDSDNKYSSMQKEHYEQESNIWTFEHRDPVVGTFDAHNDWQDYDDYLFKDLDTKESVALDFGCGPGRNIVKFHSSFKRIDGVDIAQGNLENALKWAEHNKLPYVPTLYLNNGQDLSCIPGENIYDIIFSTICLQHICVHEIRLNLMRDFYRLLKPGGSLCAQMGYGPGRPGSRDYYDNFYDANGTNGYTDTRVESSDQLKNDLESIKFNDFSFDLRPVGPGDLHDQWIFFRAKK